MFKKNIQLFKFYQSITLDHYRSDSTHLEKKGLGFWSFFVAGKKTCMFYFKTDSRSKTQVETQEVKVTPRLDG